MPRLVYFSPIPWRGLTQRPQHCARILSRQFRVLWVEPKTLSQPKPPGAREKMDFLALPVFPANAKRKLIRRGARLAEAAWPLRRALKGRQLALLHRALAEDRNPILFFGHPEMADLADAFPRSRLAYDHMDDVLGFGDPPPSLRRKLERLVRRADLVNATSARLAADMELMGAKKVLRIGNGVEYSRFLEGFSLPEPAALAALPRPRVLYLGSLAEWFDFDLLFRVARSMREVSFPLVGPLRPELEFRLGQAPPNVHFLGPRPYAEVPSWMSHADLAIIPFLRSPLTEAVDPVKLHEYLASGLPVIATPFSPELKAHGEAIALAEGEKAFAEALRSRLIAAVDREALRGLAKGRDWERILQPLVDALLKY